MSRRRRLVGALTGSRAVGFASLLVVFAISAGALYASFRFNGLVNTVVYFLVFVFFATLLPVGIMIIGSGVPANAALGRLHIVLGAFAFGHHYLVEREDKWEWCPGNADEVYIDGEWHELKGGKDNRSVLGWRPFGILKYKDDQTMREIRVDDGASANATATADGGAVGGESVTRGGWNQVSKPTVSGRGSTWLVDLKRVYAGGVRKIGDVELIEAAEEIIERGHVSDGRLSGFGPMLTFMAALVLGVAVGAGVLFLG